MIRRKSAFLRRNRNNKPQQPVLGVEGEDLRVVRRAQAVFPRAARGVITSMCGLAAAVLLTSCWLMNPVEKVTLPPERSETEYDQLTDTTPDVVVALYAPYYRADLGANGQTNLTLSVPRRVREKESGRVVEYRYSERGFGSWDAERERQLHLFLLRSYFFHPGVFDDSTAESLPLDSLYARAQARDPYTRRIDSTQAEEYRRLSRTTVRPRVMGIQVRENDAGDTVFIELVAPGSPADKAGLRRGMAVLAVNDSVVTGDSAAARFVRLVGADSVTTRLTLRTAGGPRTETVGRDTVNFPTVQVDSIGGAGYIAISSFTGSTVGGGSTATEFRDALAATRRFPATILDLRDNGGGSLDQVLRMCDELISGGVMIRLVERNFKSGASLRTETAYGARSGGRGEGRAYVLLANRGSASASEIFVAALRSNLNTPFVGTSTYGKGVGQASFDLPGGEVAVVTYGTARTAEGTDYNRTGLTPTHPSTARPDALLREAAAVAVPGGLARRAAQGLGRRDADRAGLIDWNRRQAARPDVREWRERKSEIRNLKSDR